MMKAWSARDKFKAGTNFRAWVLTIVRNQFYSDKRRSWRIANMAVFIIALGVLVFREKLLDFSWPGFETLFWNWREIARIGAPASGSNMIGPLANTLVFAAMAPFGEPAVAGLGVGMRVEALALIPLFALSGSIGPITGQNGGAGLDNRVREAFVKSFLFCGGWGFAMAVLLLVLGRFLAPVFLPSAEGQAIAVTYWAIAPFAMAGYGVAMAASAGFNGLGRPLIGVVCNAFRGSQRSIMITCSYPQGRRIRRFTR